MKNIQQSLTLIVSFLLLSTWGFGQVKEIKCGKTYSFNTSTGSNTTDDWRHCGSNSLKDFDGKEIRHRFTDRPNYVHDIVFEFEDEEKRGLDLFFYKTYGANMSVQVECFAYKLRSGGDNKYYTYTIKNCKPNEEYYVAVDSKSGSGKYKIKGTCKKQGYICDNYINLNCGDEKTGHTNNGSNHYEDYTCFSNSLKDFKAKEVVYRIRNRPNYVHDIYLEFYDYDRRGLDLFVIENCGKNDYKCYTYKERSGSDPEKTTFTIHNTNPHKEYYVVIDAKNSTGNYKIKATCENNDYACQDYHDLKCGETKSGDTKNGTKRYHDYTCFKSHLKGFNEREVVYRVANHPNENYDLEVVFEDIDDRGLDLFIVENCGKADYKCYAYKERTSSDPKTCKFTLYNLDYRKDYYFIIDSKSKTGRYKMSFKCKVKGYVCDKYIPIKCGEKKYGHTKDGYDNYDDYSCYNNHLTGFHAKELVYKVENRPNYIHDIYIEFEDLFDKGLDIYVVENCGKNDYDCYVYKERTSNSPKKDKLTIPDTDPNKDYYIIIDAKNVHSSFNLTVRCEDRTQCYAACFNYLKHSNGKYDFYFPDAEYNGVDYYYWYFEHVSSGKNEIRDGGSISGYGFKHGKGLYKVALLNKAKKILCYYYIYYQECDEDYPMARAFEYEQKNCSSNTCSYELDASSSMGSNLIYHWYFTYNNKSYNTHYQSFRPDTTVKVEHTDDLLSICLVVTNYCGMSSFCIQGDCFNAYPTYTVNKSGDRDVELNFSSWNVNCENGGRKVWIDWGDGKENEYNWSSNFKPKKKYDQPGSYFVCVRFYYECAGSGYDRGCTICVCKTIVLGECKEERIFNCEGVSYTQGDYNEGKWGYTFNHTMTPNGYSHQYYSYTDLSSNETFQTDGSGSLEPGRDYLICAVYRNNEGCYYYCCQQITVYYPTNVNVHLPSKACGGNGAELLIPVTVNGLRDVTGFQFRIKVLDKNVAAIQSTILDLNQELPLDDSDVTVNEDQNFINVAWTTNLANESQSLEDGSTLFVFKVLIGGSSGDSTMMVIENPLAFNNITNQQVDVTFDNGVLCTESSVSIQGVLQKEDGSPLGSTTVVLSGDKNESTTTDENGVYHFVGLLPGNYEVTPAKSQDYHAGVNVIDLAMIKAFNRDVDGSTNLSPYQRIASNARVILDGSQLTVADETDIKRMTNFDIDEFQDYSESWMFVPKAHTFNDPATAHTENFPNSLVIEDLSSDLTGQDFYSIKVGDINGSVSTISPRSAKEVGLSFSELDGNTGDTVTVDLLASGFVSIQNMQFTVSWDPAILTFVDWEERIEALGLEANSFSTRFVDDGRLTFAHSLSPEAVTFADSMLFGLRFVIVGNQGQSTDISLIDDPVEVLVTDDQLDIQTVNATAGMVSIGMSTANGSIKINRALLGENRPNPFSDITYIPFTITRSGEVDLHVLTSTGEKVFGHTQTYSAGSHLIKVDKSQVSAPGVYFYRLVTQEGQATKSMVFIQ